MARGFKVNFATGSLFGFSRSALEALVLSGCMRRVSEVRCEMVPVPTQAQSAVIDHLPCISLVSVPQVRCEVPCRRSRLQQCEDAVVGLCMHLLQVRISHVSPYASPSISPMCMHLLQVPFVDTSCIVTGSAVSTSPPEHIARQMLSRMEAQCRQPITFHAAKTGAAYLKQWDAFSLQERRAESLRAAGRACGADLNKNTPDKGVRTT